MNIAMVTWEYPPQFSGGLGIHCQAIVNQLTAMGNAIDFYLPFATPESEFDIPNGMQLHLLNIDGVIHQTTYTTSPSWELIVKYRHRLEEVFKPENVDIIHAHDWMGVFAALELSKRHNIPLIWTVHSTEFDRAAGMPINPGIFAIEEEALRRANLTIAVSHSTRQCLINRYNADPEKIKVIYNGLDVSRFQQLSHRDYDLTNGNILFLGRVTRQKAPDIFLEAARIVLAQRDVRFVIAGDGDLLKVLQRRARSWKIEDRVEFIGKVVEDEVLKCYRKAYLFVLAARSEPFGITVLEAMASGLPTIISTNTGAGEVADNVLRVPPNNAKELASAILILLDNQKMRQTLGIEAAKEAQKWSWTQVALEIKALYEQLLTKE